MKMIVSDELKHRLINAAANGSIVAKDILIEIRKNADVTEVIKGSANYFSTKRKKQTCELYNKVKVIFTACTKDVTHQGFPDKNNPQAPWFPENRTDIEPGTFVGYFKHLPDYDDDTLSYFANAMCVNSKVHIKVYDKMQDFVDAYTAENYANIAQFGESSLHGSCMRYEETSRNAADFYRNFAGAKIIIAKDGANNIVGRAVLWINATHTANEQKTVFTVLDRVYFTHSFVIRLIYDYAQRIGVHFRKLKNDFSSPCQMVALNNIDSLGITASSILEDLHLYIPISQTKWHKRGAPYLDTFYYVVIDPEKQIVLSNKKMDGCIAECRLTTGSADKDNSVCPKCGKVHHNGHELCKECFDQIYKQTAFGTVMTCGTFEYKNEHYPSILFRRGRPINSLNLYFQVEKLYR